MKDFTTIKFIKFEAIVKRKDIKHPTWFAIPNNILLHPDFLNVTGNEFKAYVWMCGVASHLNAESIRVYHDLCARQANIPVEDVISTIEKLKGKRWHLAVTPRKRTRNVRVTDALQMDTDSVPETSRARTATLQDTTLQDRTEQDINTNTSTTVAEESAPAAVALREPGLSELFEPKDENELIENLRPKTLQRWAKLYPDRDYLTRQLLRAFNYYENNPKKTPKTMRGWTQALSYWFERNWPKHVVNIKSEAGSNLNWAEIFSKNEVSYDRAGI